MNEFDSGPFSDLANSPRGRQMWEILNEPEMLARMEAVTDAKRPAVEGVQRRLAEDFQEEFTDDNPWFRYRQMVGRMVRQIMEGRGYQIDSQSVALTTELLFSKATGSGRGTKSSSSSITTPRTIGQRRYR